MNSLDAQRSLVPRRLTEETVVVGAAAAPLMTYDFRDIKVGPQVFTGCSSSIFVCCGGRPPIFSIADPPPNTWCCHLLIMLLRILYSTLETTFFSCCSKIHESGVLISCPIALCFPGAGAVCPTGAIFTSRGMRSARWGIPLRALIPSLFAGVGVPTPVGCHETV